MRNRSLLCKMVSSIPPECAPCERNLAGIEDPGGTASICIRWLLSSCVQAACQVMAMLAWEFIRLAGMPSIAQLIRPGPNLLHSNMMRESNVECIRQCA